MYYDLRQLLISADKNKYAIPAFNFSDCWELKAIVQAASEENSPVIVASAVPIVEAFSLEELASACDVTARSAPIPVILHLDHSEDANLCIGAGERGYPSVMIDGSHLSLDENIAATKKVVDKMRPLGVCVEAEIGRIRGRNDETSYDGGDYLGSVEDAVRLVRETGVDSLAVGLGNAHGFYQGKPEINFDRLREVNEAVSLPLVMHGGTGLSPQDIMTGIKNGINKVNVGTELHHVYLKALAQKLDSKDITPNIPLYMEDAVNAVKQVVKRWIKICMSYGKA